MTKFEEYKNNPEVYTQKLEDMLWENVENALSINYGHSDIHMKTDQSEKEMLKRIIKDGVAADGSFSVPKNEINDLVMNAVYNNLEKVCDWMMTTRKEFENQKDYWDLAFTVVVDPGEPIGTNIDNKFREIETDAIRIVLKRDYSDDCTFGFYLKTAYPDIDLERGYGRPTGKQYSREEIVAKDLYDFETPLEKAAFLARGNKDGVRVHYAKKDDVPTILIKKEKEGTLYAAYLGETNADLKIYRKKDGQKEKIPAQELIAYCPEMSTVLGDAIRVRDGHLPENVRMMQAKEEKSLKKENTQEKEHSKVFRKKEQEVSR